ncbi:hypothetical protein K491DRAFT_710536 [Lophiostoma macrostomum CBS 122681]|uniref:Inheritance of peroxisomes protein 1 n=1 Tax=Lophiostoma macrostomum CBS 122681 TaxID=1314788 RepID=A0A6A6TNR0_9PLEO|nr:hypothetical protein K491DRAFT_710536 [Lophiostoma macrostomum CBS 122681]
MSSPAASRTAEHAPPPASSNPGIRRSFTLPAKTTNRPRPSAPASSDGIETLFTHTSTKIVSFNASSPKKTASPSRRRGGDSASDAPNTIPWTSSTERTLAVGVLRIYRVTSSNVSFLNSGNLLHTIFPRSQCWCVDGECEFVLRIRQDSYYRIELPYGSEEDKVKIEDFKNVLSQVLQYERTQCPFARRFEVAVPERPKTPPRRRTNKPPEKAKKWLFDKTWVPERGPRPTTPVMEGSDSANISSYEEDDRSSINTDATGSVREESPPMIEATPPKATPRKAVPPSVLERVRTFQENRSVSVPTGVGSGHLPSVVGAPQEEEKEAQRREQVEEPVETLSHISSADSFYSIETSTERTPSPPFQDAEAELADPWLSEPEPQPERGEKRGRERHRRGISEVTVRAPSSEPTEDSLPHTPTTAEHQTTTPTIDVHASSPPSTPPLISDSEEDSVESPMLDIRTPPDAIRMKRLTGASQRRAFSPMPHPQNIFRPQARVPGKQFTAALVRKTCELLLGPPAHLVTIMLNIAAKISDGVFGFNTYRVRQSGEKIPCSWESSDEDEWEEDDFGIPLGNLEGSTLRRRAFNGELD